MRGESVMGLGIGGCVGWVVTKVKRYYPLMQDEPNTMKLLDDSQLCLEKLREAHAAGH